MKKDPSLKPDLIMRSLQGREELDRFRSIPYTLNHEIEHDLDSGRRRLEWLWVALRGDRVVGRVGWWSKSAGEQPLVLDIFDISELDDDCGEALLSTAMQAVLSLHATPPQYTRFLETDWHDDLTAAREVERRGALLARLGARPLAERLRLQCDAGSLLPSASTRLKFRPVAGRDELVRLMTDVVSGTLDAHALRELAAMAPAEQAALQYDSEIAAYQSPRSWWRIAEGPDGHPVGFVIPARNAYNPIIAYIGVLPAYRGRGCVDEILAEGTRVLAAEGVPRIRAATDVGNVPMAQAFARAGYRVFERQLDMVWDKPLREVA